MLELVIFDCDGVLVDSEPLSNGVLAQMLEREGLSLTLAQTRAAFQGMLLGEVRAKAEAMLGKVLPEDWLERFERERAAAFRSELTAVPGARETVESVKAAGVRVCVASQGKLAKTRLTLGLTSLRDLFEEDALFSAWSVPRGKPHPDLFLRAAAAMGASRAQACAVVEDTPSGVRAGVAAGMRVVGYAGDADERALREAGAEVVSTLAAVPVLLGLRAHGSSCGYP